MWSIIFYHNTHKIIDLLLAVPSRGCWTTSGFQPNFNVVSPLEQRHSNLKQHCFNVETMSFQPENNVVPMLKQRQQRHFKLKTMLKLNWNPDIVSMLKQCQDGSIKIWLKTWHWNNVEATSGLQRWNLVENLKLKQCWSNIRIAMLKFGWKPDVEVHLTTTKRWQKCWQSLQVYQVC